MTDETREILEAVKQMYSALDSKIDSKFDIIDERLSKIETVQENITNKNINLLVEDPITEKLNTLSEDMEVVKFDVDVVKKVVTTYSTELKQLRKAN